MAVKVGFSRSLEGATLDRHFRRIERGNDMNFLTNEVLELYVEWFKSFSNDNLVRNIRIMESLIDNDDFGKSLFIDEGIQMYNLLLDECVRRVSVLASLGEV